ncbi:polysaccharide deacetylase family protein [Kangiella taiwanensis]|uniref:DUF3473 domain-containing protein n=1 Tax=Kangiella taiwanensis TaxID=1079179 RepID=A0ABP8I0V6_9GAMM|nr:polysaccharide deacetylase family protein [Kangiella taiwanensis]
MKILSFDIEDWFHLLDVEQTSDIGKWGNFESRIHQGVHRILDLLDECDQKATFFILGWVAEVYPTLVQEISKRGHDLGSHSYAHKLVYEMSKKDFKEDLARSKHVLEDTISKSVVSYRAPGFSIVRDSLWAYEILYELGFRVDSSIFPASRAHGGISSFPFAEPVIGETLSGNIKLFPLNSIRLLGNDFVFSGGGYFRLLPKALLEHWFNKENYIMTYFHPRDFDPEQPVVPGLSINRKFKSYVGLKSSLNKLSAILKSNDFITLKQACNRVDWSNVSTVKIK